MTTTARDRQQLKRLRLLTERIARLAEHKSIEFLELAIALTDLKRHHVSNFRDVVRKAGLSLRKAYYLVSVGEKLAPHLEQRAADLRAIGWTKLSILAPKLGASSEDLLDQASSLTARQLSALVRGRTEPPSMHCVLLYFDGEQYERLVAALVANGAKKIGRGLQDQERALMSIIDNK